jgi:general secretion pathway protein G
MRGSTRRLQGREDVIHHKKTRSGFRQEDRETSVSPCLRGGFSHRRSRGFTLVELMIVISIIFILLSVAAPMYQLQIVHAREAVLREDLFTLRNAIDQYTLDKQKAPQSLDDVVSAGYLKAIPKDPMTNSSDTWQTVQEDVMMSVDQTQPGITDVHSGSNGSASDGTAYSSW